MVGQGMTTSDVCEAIVTLLDGGDAGNVTVRRFEEAVEGTQKIARGVKLIVQQPEGCDEFKLTIEQVGWSGDEREGTTPHADAPSLEDYGHNVQGQVCGTCGVELVPAIEYYEHDGGWWVQGFERKQWLYVTCPGCKYQWALLNLGVQRPVEAP